MGIQDTEEEEQVADAATAGLQSAQDKEIESKTEKKADDVAAAGVQEEHETEKAEEMNVEKALEKLKEDDTKDNEEESKALQGEPEAEQAEPKEKVVDVATEGLQSTQNMETVSKTEEKAEGKTEEEYEKEMSEERNFEAPKKLIEDDTIKPTEEESKSLQGELKAER